MNRRERLRNANFRRKRTKHKATLSGKWYLPALIRPFFEPGVSQRREQFENTVVIWRYPYIVRGRYARANNNHGDFKIVTTRVRFAGDN